MLVNQKILKPNASHLLFAMLFVFALSDQPVARAEDFSVTNSRKSATAVVGANKEFRVTFDPSLASTVNDYTRGNGKSFILTICSCRLDIFAQKVQAGGMDAVMFDIRDPSVKHATPVNPDGFTVNQGGVIFETQQPICVNNIKFEPHPAEAGKFLVKVELDGNQIPASFGLKSNVPLYIDSSKDNSNKYLVWTIIGVCAIVVLAIVIIGVIVAVYLKGRKKKALVVKPTEPALKTALSLSKTADKSKEQKVLGKDANNKSKKDGNPKKAITKTSNAVQPKLSKELMPSKPKDHDVPAKADDKVVPMKAEVQAMPAKAEGQAVPMKAEVQAMPSKPEDQLMPSKPENQAIPIKPENQVVPSKALETAAPAIKNNDEDDDDDSSGLLFVTKIPQAQLDREARRRREEEAMQREEEAAKRAMKRNKKPDESLDVTIDEDNQPP